jgi:hypothetical protein
MFKLNAEHVTSHGSNEVSIEASELSRIAGGMASAIHTTLGNKHPLVLAGSESYDGEIQYWVYRQQLGTLRLTVWND